MVWYLYIIKKKKKKKKAAYLISALCSGNRNLEKEDTLKTNNLKFENGGLKNPQINSLNDREN
jgi:hypothetical protein